MAGRAAYQLVLTPKSTATLVGSIAIAVDGQSGLPLGVEVKARGQADPAFRLAFTSLKLEAPDASVFQFTPPPGATVKEIPVPEHKADGATTAAGHRAKDARRHSVSGTGWESVVELPAPADRSAARRFPVNRASGAAALLAAGDGPRLRRPAAVHRRW